MAKYSWVDLGSSFLPSDLTAAFLLAQLEKMSLIQKKRLKVWHSYERKLKPLAHLGFFKIPTIPSYATNNAHMFYILCRTFEERGALIEYLKKNQIFAIFHYLPLHSSSYYQKKHGERKLPFCDYYSDCLLRLPFYAALSEEEIQTVVGKIGEFYDLLPMAKIEPPARSGSHLSIPIAP